MLNKMINSSLYFIATSLTFYLAYILSISEWKLYNYISLLIPVILTALVFIIADSTYSYKKLMDDYSAKWEQYIHEN